MADEKKIKKVSAFIQAHISNSQIYVSKDGIDAFHDVDTGTPTTNTLNNYVPPYLDRGTAGFLLQAAAYYDPNLRNNRLGPGSIATGNSPFTSLGGAQVQMNNGVIPGQGGGVP